MKSLGIFSGISICLILYILNFYSLSLSASLEVKLDKRNFLDGDNYPYTPILNNEFPIIASYPCPPGKNPTIDDFQTIRECGFNVVSYALSHKLVDKAIALAQESNIKLFIRTGCLLTPQYRQFIKKYADTPEIIGWYIKDEPTFLELDSVNYYYKNIWSQDPNKISFINLVGTNIEKFTGQSESYIDYLVQIQEQFKPAVWCYDFYPISEINGKIIIDYDNFYSDLEIFSSISKLTKRPFWSYCQCMSFKNNKVYRPSPTIPYLRFEAFSALAYGAQGIIYWAYAQQSSHGNDIFISAPINIIGDKTEEWFNVQKINQEIKAYTEVFLNSTMSECVHTGDKLIKDTRAYSGKFGPIKEFTGEKSGVLISLINNHEKHYIVILNHDVINPQSINVILESGFRYRELLPSYDENNSIVRNHINTKIDKSLLPGGYLIIEYENDNNN